MHAHIYTYSKYIFSIHFSRTQAKREKHKRIHFPNTNKNNTKHHISNWKHIKGHEEPSNWYNIRSLYVTCLCPHALATLAVLMHRSG